MIRTQVDHDASRRTVLAGASLFIGAASLAGHAVAAAKPTGDVSVMQGALALEHEGIAAYRLAGASGLLRPDR